MDNKGTNRGTCTCCYYYIIEEEKRINQSEKIY